MGGQRRSPDGACSRRPRRLTSWNDFNFNYLDISADGKRLSFIRDRMAGNVYVGQLASGGARLAATRRLTFDQWMDWPTGWTRDSKSVLFHSNRNGVLDIFRQATDAREVRAMATGQEERTDARMSPMGAGFYTLPGRRLRGKSQRPGAPDATRR